MSGTSNEEDFVAEAPVADPRITSWPVHAGHTQAAAAIQAATPVTTAPNCTAAGTTLVSRPTAAPVNVLSGLGKATAKAPSAAPAASVKTSSNGHGHGGLAR